jgi:hypothetical protein
MVADVFAAFSSSVASGCFIGGVESMWIRIRHQISGWREHASRRCGSRYPLAVKAKLWNMISRCVTVHGS